MPALRGGTRKFVSCVSGLPFAKSIWQCSDLPSLVVFCATTSWLDYLSCLHEHDQVDQGVMAKIVILLWAIWNARNTYIFQWKDMSPSLMVQRGISLLNAYASSMLATPRVTRQELGERRGWIAPSSSFCKLNVDASFQNGKGGYGFVLRDGAGALFFVGARPLSSVASILHAEAMSLWRNFEIVVGRYDCALVVESDCQVLVKQLKERGRDMSSMGAIIEGLRHLLFHVSQEVFVQFAPQCGNMIAYDIAKLGLNLVSNAFWVNNSLHQF